MSFWFHTKDEGGRRQVWAIDIDIISWLLVLGLVFAVIFPAIGANRIKAASLLVVLMILVTVSGFLCLVLSKLSLLRQGVWISYGTKRMSEGNRRLYWVGYVLLGIGALMSSLYLST